jgi:hypothetical protein
MMHELFLLPFLLLPTVEEPALPPPKPPQSVFDSSSKTSLFWAKVKYDITLESLAQQTDISADRLAQLNDTDTNRKFCAQEWIAFPSKSRYSLRLAAAVDDSDLRGSRPQRASPPPPKPLQSIFDSTLQELERAGAITIKESQQIQQGDYIPPRAN